MGAFTMLAHAGHTPDTILHAIWHMVEEANPMLLAAIVVAIPLVAVVGWRLRRPW